MSKIIFLNQSALLDGEFDGNLYRVRFISGISDTFDALRRRGMKIVLLAKDKNLAVKMQSEFKFDYIIGNNFVSSGSNLNELAGKDKATIVKETCRKLNIHFGEAVFIGNEADDLKPMLASGMGISFNSKEMSLDTEADVIIKRGEIRQILTRIK